VPQGSWAAASRHCTVRYEGSTRSFNINDYKDVTAMLLSMYKEATKSNMLGYFIANGHKSSVVGTINWLLGSRGSDSLDAWKIIQKGGHAVLKTQGYDEMILIHGKNLVEKVSKIESIEAGVTKGKLKTAFASSSNTARQARAMLSDIVKRVA
jgi:hypothetical protein